MAEGAEGVCWKPDGNSLGAALLRSSKLFLAASCDRSDGTYWKKAFVSAFPLQLGHSHSPTQWVRKSVQHTSWKTWLHSIRAHHSPLWIECVHIEQVSSVPLNLWTCPMVAGVAVAASPLPLPLEIPLPLPLPRAAFLAMLACCVWCMPLIDLTMRGLILLIPVLGSMSLMVIPIGISGVCPVAYAATGGS
jgi:hypothetical protein